LKIKYISCDPSLSPVTQSSSYLHTRKHVSLWCVWTTIEGCCSTAAGSWSSNHRL